MSNLETPAMKDVTGQEMVSALREATSSIKELVEELKKSNGPVIIKKE